MGVRMDEVVSIYVDRDALGRFHYIGEFYADDVDDIKGKTIFDNVVADPDSTAYIIKAGKLCVLAGNNKWYYSDGEEV